MNKKNPQANEATIIKDEIVKDIVAINKGKAGDAQLRPNMAVLIIGDEMECKNKLANLEKEAKKVGIDIHSYICPLDSDMEEIEAMTECLNEDELIDGIYLYEEVPEEFDYEKIISTIETSKNLNSSLENNNEEIKIAKLFRYCIDIMKDKEKNSQ
ncbi:hypothetical protein C0583_06745 [Candidatus Parcubacteria bacterium]|nr:MAG: hypothetical protein C0583_06745 [Candidatus Parcubacteria bacterium]